MLRVTADTGKVRQVISKMTLVSKCVGSLKANK